MKMLLKFNNIGQPIDQNERETTSAIIGFQNEHNKKTGDIFPIWRNQCNRANGTDKDGNENEMNEWLAFGGGWKVKYEIWPFQGSLKHSDRQTTTRIYFRTVSAARKTQKFIVKTQLHMLVTCKTKKLRSWWIWLCINTFAIDFLSWHLAFLQLYCTFFCLCCEMPRNSSLRALFLTFKSLSMPKFIFMLDEIHHENNLKKQ